MKTIIIICTLIVFVNCSTVQRRKNENIEDVDREVNYIPYYPIVFEADSLFISGNYKESFSQLDSLFRIIMPTNVLKEIPLYIKAAYKSNELIDYQSYFKTMITKFGLTRDAYDHYDSLFMKIFDEVGIDSITHNKWKKKFENNSFPDLEAMLTKMNIDDQMYRKGEYKNMEYQPSRDSIDSINERKLIEIFEKYGYPNSKNHRRSITTNISTLLLHTEDSIRINYFAPKVLEYVKKGDCSPITYGQIIDQYHLYKGDKQIYNTYLGSPILNDSIKTGSLRLSIGLPKSLSLNNWLGYKTLLKDKKFFIKNPQYKKLFERNIFK